MTHRIVLPRASNLAAGEEEASRGLAPRHAMWHLARALGATLHEPEDDAGRPKRVADRVRGLIAGPDSLWAFARRVAMESSSSDVLFCPSESGGLQMAGVLSGRRTRPRLAVFVHNVDRPRARVALRWWSMAKTVDLFLACSQAQVDFLRSELGLSQDRVRFVSDHTDTAFFTPASGPVATPLPRIVSVGLEQRDYRTLGEATQDLDVEVRISGFSKDAAALARTFPDPMPANMSRRFYAWPDLVELYRSAAVVVVACRENRYAAGVQSLMEASACGRPVIATATTGLRSYLHDAVRPVPAQDAQALRAAIVAVLSDRSRSEADGATGLRIAHERFSFDRYVAEIAAQLRSLA